MPVLVRKPPTREEFDKLEDRVTSVAARLAKVEQALDNPPPILDQP